jgi:phosphoserine phosphatase
MMHESQLREPQSREALSRETDGWVVTVLGRAVSEEALARVYAIVTGEGLQIERRETLAGKEASPPGAGTSYAGERLWARGAVRDEAGMRRAFLALSDELAVDVAWQAESAYRREWRLFVFDMDSTLIQGEVIDELAKMAGVADRVVAITTSAMRGEIEFQESFRRRVALLAGLPEARAKELLERIPLMEGAERLFQALKRMGARTAILSGGFTFFGAHLKEKLGVDYVHANELDVLDGFVTGEVRGRIVDGARKAELLGEIARIEGIPLEQVVAVGDGANDLPMLRLAGMGVAFHAKPVVRASAQFAMTHVGLDGLLELMELMDRG